MLFRILVMVKTDNGSNSYYAPSVLISALLLSLGIKLKKMGLIVGDFNFYAVPPHCIKWKDCELPWCFCSTEINQFFLYPQIDIWNPSLNWPCAVFVLVCWQISISIWLAISWTGNIVMVKWFWVVISELVSQIITFLQ